MLGTQETLLYHMFVFYRIILYECEIHILVNELVHYFTMN